MINNIITTNRKYIIVLKPNCNNDFSDLVLNLPLFYIICRYYSFVDDGGYYCKIVLGHSIATIACNKQVTSSQKSSNPANYPIIV